MEKKRKRILLSLSIPAFRLIVIFMIVPLGNALRVSFFKWNGYSQKMKFIGLKNYRSLFSDKVFWRSTVNTFIYGFGSTLLQNIMGLSAAIFVNKEFKGRNFVRLILYMPIMISGVIMGAIFLKCIRKPLYWTERQNGRSSLKSNFRFLCRR